MDPVEIEVVADSDLDDPLLIEGLPGVGHVGKLAARTLVDELDAEPVARVYSQDFPPQVTVDADGTTELTHATFHAASTEGGDLLVLTGDHQAGSNRGHYRITDAFLDAAESMNVSRLFALGGVPTGELVEERAVLGAATSSDFVSELQELGVEFRDDDPAGGIVGVSGLLLGLGERRGLPAACLMGETSGYLVDPKSGRAVLEVLTEYIGIEGNYGDLEQQAEELQEVVRKMQEMEREASPEIPADEDLRYIG